MNVDGIGSICIGIVIIYITMMLIIRLDKITAKGISIVIGTIAGGTIVNFIQKGALSFGFYSIGLLIGFTTLPDRVYSSNR